MWVVECEGEEKISAINSNKAHDWGVLSCCSHPPHSTKQCYCPPQSTIERKEEGSKTYRGPAFWNGARGLEYVVYVSVFLVSIRCNLVVISLINDICDQQSSCLPLAGRPETAPGRPAPAPHHILTPNCRNFLPDGEQRFHPRGRKIKARLHDVTAQNKVTFQHHGCAAQTNNLAVLY